MHRSLCQGGGRALVAGFAAWVWMSFAAGNAARGQGPPADALWRTYFNAAVVEIEASQGASDEAIRKQRNQNAILLLKSALDVADRVDPGGPRPRMSSWLLYFIYNESGESETAEKILAASKQLDLKKFGAELITEAATIDQLANTYLDHSKDEGHVEVIGVFAAYNCVKWEVGISMNAYHPGDVQLAKPIALYALTEMRLGNIYHELAGDDSKEGKEQRQSRLDTAVSYLTASIADFKAALDVWEKNRQQEETLAANSERYMVSQGGVNASFGGNTSAGAGANETQDPNSVQLLVSNTYRTLGDLYAETKDTAKAQEAYKNAEAPLNTVLKAVEARWPHHVDGAYDQNLLGLLYLRENRYTEAESEFRTSLETIELSKGKSAEDTKTLAGNLAYTLKRENRAADAERVARQYSVKVE